MLCHGKLLVSTPFKRRHIVHKSLNKASLEDLCTVRFQDLSIDFYGILLNAIKPVIGIFLDSCGLLWLVFGSWAIEGF